MSSELRRARNRQMVIFFLICLGLLVMLGRLYYWQILQSQDGYHLAARANAEHTENQVVDAPRGLIYDIRGQLLATNVVRDDVYIEPIQFAIDHPDTDKFQSDLQSLVSTIHQVLPQIPADTLTKDFNSGQATVRIAATIDPAQSQQLRKLRLPDIFLEPHTLRIYPNGDLAAQILGYVQEGEGGKGVYGLEAQYNSLLAGKAGSFTAETDLNGNPLTVGYSSQQAAVSGANLTLTIDSTMQYFVQSQLAMAVQKMGAQSGSAVVVDTQTGAVVSMAGYPTFDPNNYGDYANLKGCLGKEDVYFNPALFCSYEPGSTMKAVTMAAALDQGLITPDTSLNDPGSIRFDDAPVVYNWEKLGYGQETMTQVLEHSANVGAAWVAHNKLGADRYYPYLQRFGFGQPTGIDGAEDAGYYRTNTSAGWTPSDLTRQSFGQSITATPLQVAMAYEAIANGGVLMKPYLVASVNNNGHVTRMLPQVQRRVISAQAAQLLTGMLEQAASIGMAKTVAFTGYSIAAKTGTATTQGISDTQTEASVAGYLPASHPRFVILVKLDRPQATIYGGTAAAPLWKAIAQQLMWYYSVPPDQP